MYMACVSFRSTLNNYVTVGAFLLSKFTHYFAYALHKLCLSISFTPNNVQLWVAFGLSKFTPHDAYVLHVVMCYCYTIYCVYLHVFCSVNICNF